jgi:DNA invertase Pin-like site-specific DNA recombinase
MTVVGYARVSTTDQDLSIQEAALRAAGCDVIRAEKQSGTKHTRASGAAHRARLHRQRRRVAGHAC